jgi:hypothetical protein
MTTPNAALADELQVYYVVKNELTMHFGPAFDRTTTEAAKAVSQRLTALRQPSSVSRVREALEAALCAPSWSDSLGHVHESLAALPLDEVSDESRS